jgi:predicted transcriptional regulator
LIKFIPPKEVMVCEIFCIFDIVIFFTVFMNDFHIGNLIKEKVEEKKISVTEFAKMIHCERTNVYHIFANDNIDLKRLIKIQEALEYNFLSDIFSEIFPKNKITIELKITDIQDFYKYKDIFAQFIEMSK